MDGQLYPSHSGYAAGHNQRQQLLDAWRLDAHEVIHGSEGLAQGLEGVILGSGSVQRVVARKAGYASARDAHSPSPHGNRLHDVTSASGMRLAPHRAETPSTKHPSGLVVFSNGGGAAGAMHSEQLSVDDSAWGAPRDPLMEDPAFVLHDNPGELPGVWGPREGGGHEASFAYTNMHERFCLKMGWGKEVKKQNFVCSSSESAIRMARVQYHACAACFQAGTILKIPQVTGPLQGLLLVSVFCLLSVTWL